MWHTLWRRCGINTEAEGVDTHEKSRKGHSTNFSDRKGGKEAKTNWRLFVQHPAYSSTAKRGME